jgi:hypothetical protein
VIVPEFVETFPTDLREGVLYVSVPYSTAAHLCCCGCGQEVITPLSRAQWVLTFDGQVSLRPSIGNWALPCRSHYFISDGKVRWARAYSAAEIKSNRELDRLHLTQGRAGDRGWLSRLLHGLSPIWRHR